MEKNPPKRGEEPIEAPLKIILKSSCKKFPE